MTEGNNYIVELRQVGDYVKVSAIDPETMTEVSVIGSPKLTRNQLSQMAIRKLVYVLNKNKNTEEKQNPEDDNLY